MFEIRAMATSHDVTPSVDAGVRTESAYDNDYVLRIQMLSDVCHTFGQALMSSTEKDREHYARAALSYRWSVAVPEARQWIRSRLSDLGAEYLNLVDAEPNDISES